MGGNFRSTVLKLGVKGVPCILLLQSATGLEMFSHAFNSVSWFLSTLFCIYILSPVVMPLLTKSLDTKKKIIKRLIIIISLYLIVTVVFMKIDNNTFFDDLCYGSPYRRIFYVLIGMIIAMYIKYEDCKKIFIVNKSMTYIVLILAIIWVLFRNSAYCICPVICYFIDIILCGLIILLLAVSKGKIVSFLEKPIMVKLGDMSMYIFLIHYPIRMYVGLLWDKMQLHSWLGMLIEVIIIIMLSMILSYICYIKQKKIAMKNRLRNK